jgi:hypothetical protein
VRKSGKLKIENYQLLIFNLTRPTHSLALTGGEEVPDPNDVRKHPDQPAPVNAVKTLPSRSVIFCLTKTTISAFRILPSRS